MVVIVLLKKVELVIYTYLEIVFYYKEQTNHKLIYKH